MSLKTDELGIPSSFAMARLASVILWFISESLDRQERAAFLAHWLRDNLEHELITDLLDGTKTDSMPALEENRRRISIGGQRRSRTIPSSPKPSAISLRKPPPSFLRYSCCL